MQGCHENFPQHHQIDLSLLKWIEEFVDEVGKERCRDSVCYRCIAWKDDYSTKCFVEKEKREKVDEGKIKGQVKKIDFHLLGLESELCGVVSVLEGEELDIVDASGSPDIN